MSDKSQERSFLLRKNIFASFLLKGWSAGVQLLLVPLTIACLGNYVNGLWMVIASMLMWIDNCDIGLGNGLRNCLAESVAAGDEKGCKQYVSTAFIMLTFVMGILILIATVILLNINVYGILHIDATRVSGFTEVLIASVIVTCATFIFKLTGNVYLGLQLPAINNLIVTLGQTLTLCVVAVQYYMACHSLLYVALAYTLSPLLVNIIAFYYTFGKQYPCFRPSIADFDKGKVHSLLNLGVKFFIIQIAGIVLFMSSSIIISHLFSPDAVTPYQVAYRLFSLSLVVFMLVVTPFWSATTDAYKRGDYAWIRTSQLKLRMILVGIAIILFLVVVTSKWIYRIWVGDMVDVPFTLSLYMAIYLFEIIFSQAYSFLLNGMGVLNLQLIMTSLAALLFVPLAMLIGGRLGIEGICIALIIVNFPGTVANVLQFNHVLSSCQKQTA